MRRRDLLAGAATAATLPFVARSPALAQAQNADEQFFRKQPLSLISYSPGVSDLYARLLARHMSRFIPGAPNIVVQGMPGAGGLKAIEYLYNIAPKDGSVICTIGSGLPFEPILGRSELKFDPNRLTWLGSMSRSVSVGMSWHTSSVKTLDDLMQRELLIPGTGVGADSQLVPAAINQLTGTRFKIISGYPNILQAALAMESGEVEGMGYWTLSSVMSAHPTWIAEKKVNVLFHTGQTPQAELPGVPMIRTRGKTPVDAEALDFVLAREVIGRPFVAPPDLPPARAKILRDAFSATLRDPEFLKDAEKSRLDISLVDASEAEALLKKASSASPDVIRRVIGQN
jgi:tripartite-type tricarboxylate transporter receptor subunit TctC